MTDPGPRRISGSNELARAIVSVLDLDGNPIGSGFIVARCGLVLTAAHVIRDCGATAGDMVKLGFVGKGPEFELEARVDEHHFFPQAALDTAVLRPLAPLHGFCVGLEFGDSGDLLGRTLTSYGFPSNRTGGIGAAISGVSYQPEPASVQFSSTDVAPGFSGGPLVDKSTLRVIGVIRAILGENEVPGRLNDVGFAVPIEAIGAAIAGEYVMRPRDLDIARLLEQISIAINPRVQWPTRRRMYAVPLDATVLVRLTEGLAACLAAARPGVVAELLLRLPQDAVEATVRGGAEPGVGDWARALVTACAVDLDGLPVLVAALFAIEAGAPASLRAFAQMVQTASCQLYGEADLRTWIERIAGLQIEHAELRRRVDALVLAEQRGELARVEARHVPGWGARALADRQPDGQTPMLERLVNGDVPPALATRPNAGVQGVLTVVIHSAAEQRFDATIWATRDSQPMINVDAEDAGSQTRETLLGNIYRARDEQGQAWNIPSWAWTVEFALPCELLQLDCEEWPLPVSPTRSGALGGHHTVYLRSREWMYDKSFEAYQPDWQANWLRYHADPRLTWLDEHETRDPDALFAALKGTPGVGLKYLHEPTQAIGTDPVHLCVEAMVPVVLWRRGPDGEALGRNECDDLRSLPAWVREQRRPRSDRPANRGLVLIWNDPGRIPPDARTRKFNVPRKATP